jgi:hypothetical protein
MQSNLDRFTILLGLTEENLDFEITQRENGWTSLKLLSCDKKSTFE